MFNKILIANRGEIAVRIIRTCKEMGIKAIAIYSMEDRESLHVQLADEAICVGPADLKKSYLNINNIISAIQVSGAEAVHPGFGFLSENKKFASICEDIGVKFIGPSAEVIGKMGNKSEAKRIMKSIDIPVIEGSNGAVPNIEEAIKFSNKIGYPVMIKASAGGGGRGIRVAYSDEELELFFKLSKKESFNAFGDDTLYIEKFIKNPRHIEFQVLGDSFGNLIHLGERECSIQRKNQKIIEEAPAVVINDLLRKEMGKMAVKAAKFVGYENAGTIEFLVDEQSNYFFMEMNTRIQVEHGITELITGVDLVRNQIKIASGEKLEYKQEDIKFNGHAIECRINAENPKKEFLPSPGKIKKLHFPGGLGIRVDSSVYQGYTMPIQYDSMLAKLMVHDSNRSHAINKIKRALSEIKIEGIETNIEFNYEILHNQYFIDGKYDTGFISEIMSL